MWDADAEGDEAFDLPESFEKERLRVRILLETALRLLELGRRGEDLEDTVESVMSILGLSEAVVASAGDGGESSDASSRAG